MTDLLRTSRTGASATAHASQAGAAAGPRAFPLAGDTPHYARDLVVDVRHIKLEIAIDPKAKHIAGTATHYRAARSTTACARVEFDAAEMQISGVTVGGKPAKFDYATRCCASTSAARAEARAPRPRSRSTYAAHPRRGLYFVAPDKDYPKKPLQAWTQGQDEDSRHWYPCIDFPNHQQTSEVIVTVPAAMISIGNGELKSVREDKRATARRRYHWYQAMPHVTYLLSQIVGDFAEIEHRWRGHRRCSTTARAAARRISQRTLDRTPKMLRVLQRATA